MVIIVTREAAARMSRQELIQRFGPKQEAIDFGFVQFSKTPVWKVVRPRFAMDSLLELAAKEISNAEPK